MNSSSAVSKDSVQGKMSCEPSYADLDVRLWLAVKAKELLSSMDILC
jgi:hypothetical protein